MKAVTPAENPPRFTGPVAWILANSVVPTFSCREPAVVCENEVSLNIGVPGEEMSAVYSAPDGRPRTKQFKLKGDATKFAAINEGVVAQ